MVEILSQVRILQVGKEARPWTSKYPNFYREVKDLLLGGKVLTRGDLDDSYQKHSGSRAKIREIINAGSLARATDTAIRAALCGQTLVYSWAGQPLDYKELALALERDANRPRTNRRRKP